MNLETQGSETAVSEERQDHLSDMSSLKFSFSARRIAALVLVISFAAWIWLAMPFFVHGELMNFDHPMHLGVIDCLRSDRPNAIFPATWCPQMMMGVPAFQGYPPLVYMGVYLLTFLFSVAASYKIILLFVWLSIPLAACWFFWKSGEPLAGAYAFAFMLFNRGAADSSGVEFLLLKGSAFNQTLSVAILIVTVYYLLKFFSNPSAKGMAVCSLLTAGVFLAHPSTFQVLALFLMVLSLQFRKNLEDNLRYFLLYPLTVSLLVSFWFVPLIAKISAFRVSGITSQGAFLHSLMTYSIMPINPLLFALGLAGLVLLWKTDKGNLRTIPLLFVLTLTFILIQTGFQSYRLFMLVNSLIFASAAFALVSLGRIRISGPAVLKIVTLCLFAVIGISLFANTKTALGELVFSDTLELGKYRDLLFDTVTDARGRVLAGETYGQSKNYNIVNFTSIFGRPPTNLFLLGPESGYFDPQYAGTSNGRFNGVTLARWSTSRKRSLEYITPSEARNMLSDLNIEYILAAGPGYTAAFSFLEKKSTIPGLTTYWNNETTISYFYTPKGRIIDESFSGTEARTSVDMRLSGNLTVKTRYFDNWKAYSNGKILAVQKREPDHLILLNLPAGKNEVHLRYETLPIDILGWVLSFIGIGVLIFHLKTREHYK